MVNMDTNESHMDRVRQIRLLAFDIDGTLLRADHQLSDVVRKSVHSLKGTNIQVVLATGRRYGQAFEIARELELETPLIAAGGAVIKNIDTHQTLFRAKFRPEILRQSLMVAHEAEIFPFLYSDRYTEGVDVIASTEITEEMPELYPEYCEYFARNVTRMEVRPELFAPYASEESALDDADSSEESLTERTVPLVDFPKDLFTWFAIGSWNDMYRLRDLLNERLPGQLEMNVLRGPKYSGVFCEVLPAGIHKWSAIQWVARRMGIADAEICAVGDDVNDIRMLRGAGIGVAMGNARAEVIAAADVVAPTNTEDGACDIIHWLKIHLT
ncbi:MAG: HAD family hydrolase [Thermoguttaceae bacterium]|nr:HAD family hydrolase [Thermoguttaceae bacterium]